MIAPLWISALAISLPLTVGLARLLLNWAPRWRLIDRTNRRKAHRGNVPIGGLAVIGGSAGAFVPVLWQAPLFIWWIVGAFIVAGVGLIDDRRSVSPWLKLGVQTGAAALALPGGLDVTTASVLGLEVQLGVVGIPVLGLWIVGATNAFNLTDGLDGLACGAAVVLALASVGMSAASDDRITLAMAAALGGSALGFLTFNRHPAQLFLGDGGSYFLGFLLAIATLQAAQSEASTVMPLGVLALVWGYPIADTLSAILRRVNERRPILSPDRAHLHHRLLAAVGDYGATVGTLYAVFVLLAIWGVFVWMIGR